jgi:hypothetical protein
MSQELTLFVGMFTTLLAIINPLEALPVFLKLLEGTDEAEHSRVARLSCFYALLLAFFFLFSSSAMSRPAPGIRRHGEVPDRSPLEGSRAVLRVFPRR